MDAYVSDFDFNDELGVVTVRVLSFLLIEECILKDVR